MIGQTQAEPLRHSGPLTIADVYVSPGLDVVAAPAWAFHPGSFGMAYRPVEEAWRALWGELARLRLAKVEADEARSRAWLESVEKAATDPDAPEPQRLLARQIISARARAARQAPPERRSWGYFPQLDDSSRPVPRPILTCLVCRAEYVAVGRVKVCSNRCAKARRDATRVRGEPRRIDREPRECGHCGGRFFPPRCDARFCSGRCRVAHHRAAHD